MVFLAIVITSCSEDKVGEFNDNAIGPDRVTKINFGENIRYSFEYFNKYYSVTPQVRRSGEFEDANTGYEITRFNNQTDIRISNGMGSQGALYIRGKFEGTRLIQVIRYYTTGRTYTYNFEYLDSTTRITLIFDADGPDGDFVPRVIEYGDYILDNNGNVREVLKYRNYEETPTENDIYEQSVFTYDQGNNAWQDRLLFFFGFQMLPDARFFSANNILTYQRIVFFNQPAGNFEFSYEYDDQGRTTKAFTAWFPLNIEGFVESFIYAE